MKIKIVSDGTTFGTKVLNAETGEPLRDLHIKRIVIDPLGPNGLIQVELLLDDIPFDIETELGE